MKYKFIPIFSLPYKGEIVKWHDPDNEICSFKGLVVKAEYLNKENKEISATILDDAINEEHYIEGHLKEFELLKMAEEFTCSQCNQTKPVQKNGGTGYGCNKEDKLICYECCGINDKKEMEETGKFVGYIFKDKDDKWYFTNWPGTLKIPAYIEKSRHNWGHVKRTNVYFHFAGYQWYGVNLGESQICRAKRTKTKS